MESQLRHWDREKGIRVTIYLVCIAAIAVSIGLSVYVYIATTACCK